MAGWIADRRASRSVVLALLALLAATLWPAPSASPPRDLPPNVLIVLTDDQTIDTLGDTLGAPAMPWLDAQLQDPDQPWVRFTNAFLDTPLCCPSRASILTGLTSAHTGVETNTDGFDLDENSTLATWLDAAGYTTALIGKYLNDFPWDRGPYVPPGWDRFLAKQNQELGTTYYGFDVIDQAVPATIAPTPDGYATDYLADRARSFLQDAPADRPWFLLFSPPAPHEPWVPAPSDRGAFAGSPIAAPSLRTMNDVRGKPGWIRALPPITVAHRRRLRSQERRERETLLAVDRAMRAMVGDVAARGELDRTLVVFLTDNGFSFGEHRWIGKRCGYDPCVHTPMAIRSPWASNSTVDEPVLNIDLAPTFLDFVRAVSPIADPPVDGVSLRPYLDRRSSDPPLERPGIVLRYVGDAEVPAWRSLRTSRYAYIENGDGTRELYDLVGSIGDADPDEARNRIDDERYRQIAADLRTTLGSLLSAPPRR